MNKLLTFVLLLGVGLSMSACDEKKKPAKAPDPACANAYDPPMCLGGPKICETDKNGCVTCTCNRARPADDPLPQ